MSYDLLMMREAAPRSVQLSNLAIYRDAQAGDRKIQRARNVADLLERGHRSRPNRGSGILVDIRV